MSWWRSLAPRERLFLGWGVFITLMLGLYMGVAQPLETKIAQAETRLQITETELNKIREIAVEYQKLGKSKKRAKTKMVALFSQLSTKAVQSSNLSNQLNELHQKVSPRCVFSFRMRGLTS